MKRVIQILAGLLLVALLVVVLLNTQKSPEDPRVRELNERQRETSYHGQGLNPLLQFVGEESAKKRTAEELQIYSRLVRQHKGLRLLPDLPSAVSSINGLFAHDLEYSNYLEATPPAEMMSYILERAYLSDNLINQGIPIISLSMELSTLIKHIDLVKSRVLPKLSQLNSETKNQYSEFYQIVHNIYDQRVSLAQKSLIAERDQWLEDLKAPELEAYGGAKSGSLKGQIQAFFYDSHATQRGLYDYFAVMIERTKCLTDHSCSSLCKEKSCAEDKNFSQAVGNFFINPVGAQILGIILPGVNPLQVVDQKMRSLEKALTPSVDL